MRDEEEHFHAIRDRYLQETSPTENLRPLQEEINRISAALLSSRATLARQRIGPPQDELYQNLIAHRSTEVRHRHQLQLPGGGGVIEYTGEAPVFQSRLQDHIEDSMQYAYATNGRYPDRMLVGFSMYERYKEMERGWGMFRKEPELKADPALVGEFDSGVDLALEEFTA